jgi:hypothetical protein
VILLRKHRYIVKLLRKSKSKVNTNLRTVLISGREMKKDSTGDGYKIINYTP